MRSVPKTCVRIGVGVCILSYSAFVMFPGMVLGLFLLFDGETAAARFAGITAVCGLPVPCVLYTCMFLKGRRRRGLQVSAALAVVMFLMLIACALSRSGSAGTVEGAAFQSIFFEGTGPSGFSPVSLVPEVDQLKLGTRVLPMLDPIIDGKQAGEIRDTFLGVYREAQQDPEFQAAPSVMHYSYRAMFLGPQPHGHIYQYVPRGYGRDRLPAILFLHGALGNFKGYMWVWKQFADEHGFVIVAPTFGAGVWHRPGGRECLRWATDYCQNHERIDPNRIHLAGLSNGGIGVLMAAKAWPKEYRSLIFISPVLPKALVSEKFCSGWKGRPVFVISGEEDSRTPMTNVQSKVLEMSRNDVSVRLETIPDADHFVFFSQRGRVLKSIRDSVK